MVGMRQLSCTAPGTIAWLDVPEPELYVTAEAAPNAFTFGHTKPFITLTAGLIDMLSDEELFFVIGHEVGHIKAGHVLYGTMALLPTFLQSLLAYPVVVDARNIWDSDAMAREGLNVARVGRVTLS